MIIKDPERAVYTQRAAVSSMCLLGLLVIISDDVTSMHSKYLITDFLGKVNSLGLLQIHDNSSRHSKWTPLCCSRVSNLVMRMALAATVPNGLFSTAWTSFGLGQCALRDACKRCAHTERVPLLY